MTELTLPIQRTTDHIYYGPPHKDGNCPGHPGATANLSVLDKSGALMTWAARETATAAVGMAREGDGSSRLTYLISTIGEEGAIKALSSRANWKRDEAAQLGSEVHRMAEDLHGTLEHADPAVSSRVGAYRDWWQNSGWSKPLTEVIGINCSVGYGGTIDLLARDADGRLVLADIKTGGKVGRKLYNNEILQLAAYGQLTYIMVGTELRVMPNIDRYVILHVTLDGVREIEVSVSSNEITAFLDCVDLYRWTQAVKGRL